MEIYPADQFASFLLSFSAGVFYAFCLFFLRVIGVLLGAHRVLAEMRPVYERPLPFLRHATPLPRERGNLWRQTVIFAGDFLCALFFAVFCQAILYVRFCGQFRP